MTLLNEGVHGFVLRELKMPACIYKQWCMVKQMHGIKCLKARKSDYYYEEYVESLNAGNINI